MTAAISTLICRVGFAFILLIVTTSALSKNVSQQSYRPYFGLSIGYNWGKTPPSQTLTLLPPFQNRYNSTAVSQGFGDIGVTLGIERSMFQWLRGRFSLEAYINDDISPKGEVWLFALPAFNNLAYRYQVHHRSVLLSGQFLFDALTKYKLVPFITTAIGLASNRSADYQEVATVVGAVPTLPFGDRTRKSISWRLGIGLDHQLSKHTRCNITYLYADLGSAALGRTLAATTNQHLSISHLYTQQLRLQLVYQL